LTKRREDKLKEVGEYEKKLDEINKAIQVYREQKEKIKKIVDVLIIEESSLDDEIRTIKNKKGIEKQ
jgi:prefoldin subunit 5